MCANTLNLDQSKTLSFVREFETCSSGKKLKAAFCPSPTLVNVLKSLFVRGMDDSAYSLPIGLNLGQDQVRPVLETTCIRQSTAVRDHCSDTTPLLKSIFMELAFKDHFHYFPCLWIQVILYLQMTKPEISKIQHDDDTADYHSVDDDEDCYLIEKSVCSRLVFFIKRETCFWVFSLW